MSNPLWKAGMTAVNPAGRPKHSVRTIEGVHERLILGYFTNNRVKKILKTLPDKDQLNFYTMSLNILLPKRSIEGMSAADVDKLHDQLMTAINNKNVESKAG